MASKPNRDPSEILGAISEKARQVKEAAVLLTDNIEVIQTYLASIKGRTETACSGVHPDDINSERSLTLKFHKDGSSWTISWARVVNDEDIPFTFKPLLQAPLRIKVAAARMLPDLIEFIEDQQDKLLNEVNEAANTLDAFYKKLPRIGVKP
jgi:hypothetical protein